MPTTQRKSGTAKTTRRRKVAKKTASKKAKVRAKAPKKKTAIQRIESELPKDLRVFSRQVRRDLTQLEKQIEGAQKDVRRGMTRVLRDVSHQLGRFESEGERRWKKLTNQARRDAVKALKKLEKVIGPPQKKTTTKKKATKAKTRAR